MENNEILSLFISSEIREITYHLFEVLDFRTQCLLSEVCFWFRKQFLVFCQYNIGSFGPEKNPEMFDNLNLHYFYYFQGPDFLIQNFKVLTDSDRIQNITPEYKPIILILIRKAMRILDLQNPDSELKMNIVNINQILMNNISLFDRITENILRGSLGIKNIKNKQNLELYIRISIIFQRYEIAFILFWNMFILIPDTEVSEIYCKLLEDFVVSVNGKPGSEIQDIFNRLLKHSVHSHTLGLMFFGQIERAAINKNCTEELLGVIRGTASFFSIGSVRRIRSQN